ncbi:D-erythrulose kinase [Prauserella marina]|uniref:Dihydroxyacetone kinase n=1 Tax=Prauserella marina TaxID=530584 RepID=A0A222VPI2_9PSEU|nr:dihydroxyacetone kinase family protein [Prauserella marina]ASR35836.1 D-erythrulose kinase [Prauserella marina]PWV84251.1 homodimeric dihydroxyacetone kinase [Prauserella marina]SDC27015.1 dihydroxyacetone kinase [Prauserella marina]
MTRLFNDPAEFADEVLDGFVAAHQRWVRRVRGGVVRNSAKTPGQVAVLVGGGSGHYPAFTGLVGQGLAHGSVPGNIFASPSAQQACSVAKAAESGGGVLLLFGNYAGDVLHFGHAAEILTRQGIPAKAFAVTDDVSSANADEAAKRRGVAGGLTVFKAAAAAAEAGLSLEEVYRVAERANARTRSLGVAFSGCTLPGADAPLFTVPEGKMAVGMGIHGEPGIQEADVPSADGLAELFVSTLLTDLPSDITDVRGQRAAVILNGLGTVKHEELFVVYRRVARLLAEAGVEVVEPEVGEFVTSFDLAGASLTLSWLDEELERYWTAPADAPAFRKGSLTPAPPAPEDLAEGSVEQTVREASEQSRAAAGVVLAALEAAREVIDGNADELGRIDAVAGDGDHGIGMQRGAVAAVDAAREALERGAGAGTLLALAGDAWADKAGGTSGALWGLLLHGIANTLGDNEKPTAETVSQGVAAGLESVLRVGGAKVGDKTMVDVLVPFAETLAAGTAESNRLAEAWGRAAERAEAAARATADLVPRIGRARPLADKSVGTPDAGAVSLALIAGVVHGVLDERKGV